MRPLEHFDLREARAVCEKHDERISELLGHELLPAVEAISLRKEREEKIRQPDGADEGIE